MSEYVCGFEKIGVRDRPVVGGKGASLGSLTRAGFAVPPGFVIKRNAFERFLEVLECERPVRSRVGALAAGDIESIAACSQEVRSQFERTPLPESMAEEIAVAHAGLLAGRWSGAASAVRSSATTEDTGNASFAGLQDTFLWVRSTSEMLARVRTCWASLYSTEAIDYRLKKGFPEADAAMAVVIQKMVDARVAGVTFTRSPITGDRSVVVIEAAWGLGSALVGGEVTPDQWVVSKITREALSHVVSHKAIQHVAAAGGGTQAVPVAEDLRDVPSLSDVEVRALTDVARKVERYYGGVHDIEWAIDWERGRILLLQCRPETVWSSRDLKPVARSAKNPWSHVMTIFGGRR